MEYLVVAFRSRAQTIKFSEYLRLNGIYGEIINTPKEARSEEHTSELQSR